MITIAHNIFNGVDQAIHVDYGFGILDLGLDVPKSSTTILVNGSHVIIAENESFLAGKQWKNDG